MGFKTKYVIMNENIAIKLDEVNKMTILPSEVAFDARDLQTLLLSRGAGVISSITIDDISELNAAETLAQYMNKALQESLYANTDFMQAKGCAFLFEFPEGGSIYLTEEALYKAQKEVGMPFEVFTGIYENKGRKRSVVMHVVVTGLPFPTQRLQEIQSQLEDQVSSIQARIEQSQTQTFSGNGKSLLDRFVNPTAAKPAAKPPGESTLDKLLKNKNK
jgi:cell division GTPase FtsZ